MAAFAKHKIYVFFLSDAPEISPDVEKKKRFISFSRAMTLSIFVAYVMCCIGKVH